MSSDKNFETRVKGKVCAELVAPEPLAAGSSLRHYKIRLFLETSNPQVERVIYKLDPTYYDPVRESLDASNKFAVETTTYGDYPVVVEAQVGGQLIRTRAQLTELLRERHADTQDHMIADALSYIAEH